MNQDQWEENTLQEVEEYILSNSTLHTPISQNKQQKRPREEPSSSANISKEFIICLLMASRQHDSIMFVVHKLTKVPHCIPVKSTYLTNDVAHVSIMDLVRLHGVP